MYTETCGCCGWKGPDVLVACLDLEGVLVPEIWIGVAERTGIDDRRRRDHLRRDRRLLGVVLEDELARDLVLPLTLDVVEVERLAVRQHAVAHLEDLRVGIGITR